MREGLHVCMCVCEKVSAPFLMSMCFERELVGSVYNTRVCVSAFAILELVTRSAKGNRKLLEWMRGKQCDMRQVGGGAAGGADGRMDGGRRDEGGGGCCQHAVARGLEGQESLAED